MISSSDLLNAIQGRMTDTGQTQRDIALKVGMSQPHLSNLFNGKITNPQFGTMVKLCNAVGIQAQFIIPKATQ